MQGFEVDLAEVRAAAGGVRASYAESCSHVTAAPPSAAATGESALAAALAAFATSWTGGLGHLRSDLDSTASSLGTSALAYAAADERAAAALPRTGAGPR